MWTAQQQYSNLRYIMMLRRRTQTSFIQKNTATRPALTAESEEWRGPVEQAGGGGGALSLGPSPPRSLADPRHPSLPLPPLALVERIRLHHNEECRHYFPTATEEVDFNLPRTRSPHYLINPTSSLVFALRKR